jgi:hypothetical protein
MEERGQSRSLAECGVEQHRPRVGPPSRFKSGRGAKPCVYVLRDADGCHYLGCTADLETRLAQHRAGRTQTTQRM